VPGLRAVISVPPDRGSATAIEPIIDFCGFTVCEIDAAAASMRICGRAGFPERCSRYARFRPMTAPDTPTQDNLLALLPRLRRYARLLTADLRRADELVLETLSRASGRWSSPAPWPRLRHRLFAVMHRLHAEWLSQEPRKQPRLFGADRQAAGAQELPAPATLLDRVDADGMLARLSRLPVEQREVLALVVLEGLPYAEIADLLDVPIGTVMSRLRCAREGMRSMSVESEALRPAGK
jgi:RNA polymerase sigma factor (sigma-70 family)